MAMMKKEELNRKVIEELQHIPRGSFDQNMLRAYYNGMRRHAAAECSRGGAPVQVMAILP